MTIILSKFHRLPAAPAVIAMAVFFSPFAAGATVTSCRELAAINAQVPCNIRFDMFRPTDARLAMVEHGIDGNPLFSGKSYQVTNAAQLHALNGRLHPGDQLVLRDGTWNDQVISFTGTGTSDHPILIRGNHRNGVVLTGNSRASFVGANLIIFGLRFENGTAANGAVIALGDSKHPCDNCIVDRLTIDNQNAPPFNYNAHTTHYLAINGGNITIANSTFSNKWSPGTMIMPEMMPGPNEPACLEFLRSIHMKGPCHQRLDFVRNTVSNFVPGEKDPAGRDLASKKAQARGDYKFMQIGWSGAINTSSFSVIEDNIFSHENIDGEVVSVKASDLIVRGNRWLKNAGNLNLRSTNRALVDDNIFDSDLGGIGVAGAGHWIVNNTFKDLQGPPYTQYLWPISILAGAQEDLRVAGPLARVRDLTIARNSFSKLPSPPILLGWAPYPTLASTPGNKKDEKLIDRLLPTGVFIINNRFSQLKPIPASANHYAEVARPNAVVGPVIFSASLHDEAFQNITLRDNVIDGAPVPTIESTATLRPSR